MFIATQLNSTKLNSTSSCRQVHSVNNCHLSMNVLTQLSQFVGHDVINKNTTDLAVRFSTAGQLSSVELCRYKHPFSCVPVVFRVSMYVIAFGIISCFIIHTMHAYSIVLTYTYCQRFLIPKLCKCRNQHYTGWPMNEKFFFSFFSFSFLFTFFLLGCNLTKSSYAVSESPAR